VTSRHKVAAPQSEAVVDGVVGVVGGVVAGGGATMAGVLADAEALGAGAKAP